jgi:hypothetical protein
MRRALGIAVLAVLAGCAPASPTHGAPCAATPIESSVARSIRFARLDMAGHSEGFDLDGRVSAGTDPETCRHADVTSASGEQGIDNQIAALVPLIEMQAGGVTLDQILQTAINDGQLLLGIDLLGADDLHDDACVSVQTRALTGTPSLGTDGMVEIGQTFDQKPGTEITVMDGGRIVNGVLDVGPHDIALPVAILDARFTLHVHDALMHIELDDGGVWRGKVGGGISIEELITVAQGLNIPSSLMGAAMLLLQNNADLARDPMTGRCTQVSATLLFESVTAFVYD